MAKAVYEKRTFDNRTTGEIIQYDFYGIVGELDGENIELPLKSLNAAEKIAFKQIAALNDPIDTSNMVVVTKKGGEPKITKTILDEDDDEKQGFLDRI